MTEFEINKAVAEKMGVDDDYGSFKPLSRYSFDVCNNPAQAWEIILKYNICVTNYGDRFEAYSNLWVDENWCSGAGEVFSHKNHSLLQC